MRCLEPIGVEANEMRISKYLLLLFGSIFFGIVGLLLNFIYALEREADVNQTGTSGLYEAVKPFWTGTIDPMQNHWFEYWPDNLVNGGFAIPISFLFWAIMGFIVSLIIVLIWPGVKKTAK
jgi:ABC-type antimicrobial peptide transport system permease subunit